MRHRTVGLWEYQRGRATEGFTLLTPLHGRASYLVGMNGEVVHAWAHPCEPGKNACLLPGGHLLWSGETPDGPHPGGGKGGLLREYDWDGNIVWEYRDDRQHHDMRRLRNGNTVYIGWEPMPPEAAARVVGAEPGSDDNGTTWGDFLHEVTPDGQIVWEWHAHSGMKIEDFPLNPLSTRKEFLHANSVQELPDGNFLLSFRKSSTVAIVNKARAQVTWHRTDPSWGQQHDAQMLDNGNILLFANGLHVPTGVPASRVVEFDPDTGDEAWSYRGSPPHTFFSPNVSGAQRLWTGNTLICEGLNGRVFEVDPGGEIIWEFISPWFGPHQGGLANSLFRAYRYRADGPELQGRLGRPS